MRIEADDQVADEEEKTRPPISALRFRSPSDLYTEMPVLAELIQDRPEDDESSMAFLRRLQKSSTPESAITFAAFASRPKMSVWWGYECLRTMPDIMVSGDHALLELVAKWTAQPDRAIRFQIMEKALFSPSRTPAVLLALAVGWSGRQVAPNDPAPISPNRTPRSINAAILTCLAKARLEDRPDTLDKFVEMSKSLFRPY